MPSRITTGPTQQIEDLDACRRAGLRGDLLRARDQRTQEFGVHLERRGDHRGAEMQGAFNLAAPHGGGDGLAKLGFAHPEFLGQPAAHFQKTVIDRLHFPGQQSPIELPFAPRKAGHTTNHRGLRLESAIIVEFSLSEAWEPSLQIETADVSLIGHREENQDRVAVAAADQAVLLVVIDGMGGHAEGARAAETALSTLLEAFWQTPHPIFDPLGFLHMSLGRAHEEVVKLGVGLSVEARPRATCALCLVQDSAAYWAHIGDSRIYQLRQSQVLDRTRDHSHVEVLLREGLITEAEVHGHPMRNYVECCLGGDAALPEMSISTRRKLKPGDVLLLCTDGLWANLRDQDFVRFAQTAGKPLRDSLTDLGTQAVEASAPYSDNTSAAALRWRAA